MATLCKLEHVSEMYGERNYFLTHVVNTQNLGSEFTVCGMAIPDSTLKDEGWRQACEYYEGSLNKCTCQNCNRIIHYYKNLR